MERKKINSGISIRNIIISKEFLFILSMIFASYELFGISLTYIMLSLCVFYVWFIQRKRLLLTDKSFLFFMSVLFIHELIMVIVHPDDARTIINNIIGAVLVVVIILTLSTDIDLEKLKKAYYILAIIVSVGLIYQAILVYGLGKAVTPIQIIPNLIAHSTMQWDKELMRPMSCFIEPQAYAAFMIPVIFFLLNDKKIIWAILGTICILLSTSSLGIGVCAIMWFLILFDDEISINTKVIIIIFSLIMLAFVFNSSIFQYAIDKIKNIDTSSDARLSQGFIIYSQMPFWDQLFGIGKHSLVSYILNHNIYVPRMKNAIDVGKWSYVTTVAGMLIYYGVAGIISFAIFVIGQMKKRNYMIKEFTLLLVILSFGQTILFNVYFLLYYTLLFCFDKNKNDYIRIKF